MEPIVAEENFTCASCKKECPLIKSYKCKRCNRKNKKAVLKAELLKTKEVVDDNDDDDDDDDDDNNDDDNDDDNDDEQGPNTLLFCKKCSDTCFSCDVRGCRKCIDVVCCDCCVSMCYKCRNNGKSLCGCYGKCYTCDVDLNRGSDGWPCNECELWYCRGCRYIGENTCQDCNLRDESDIETSDDEEPSNNDTSNN